MVPLKVKTEGPVPLGKLESFTSLYWMEAERDRYNTKDACGSATRRDVSLPPKTQRGRGRLPDSPPNVPKKKKKKEKREETEMQGR